MDDSSNRAGFQNFIADGKEGESFINDDRNLDRQDEPGQSQRSKIKELGLCTIGIGIIVAAITFWLTFALRPEPGQEKSPVLIAIPFVISAFYVLLGVLTLWLKSSRMIQLNMILVMAGLVLVVAIELLVSFSLEKGLISVAFISLIVTTVYNTGRQALAESRQSMETHRA